MYHINYFNARLQAEVDAWPADILACYRNITARIIEHGADLGLPHTRTMGTGLFEIRAHGRDSIARALFCTLVDKQIVILHVFIKKTPKTPVADLQLARKRLKDIKHG